MNKKLTAYMENALRQLAQYPVTYASNRSALEALINRGLVESKYNADSLHRYYLITQAGCDYLGVSKKQVDVKYAEYLLKNGKQIRHNVRQVEIGVGGYHIALKHEYYQKTLNEAVDNVYSWQTRAIELARAEIALLKNS